MPNLTPIELWAEKLARFQAEAVSQFSTIESSPERRFTLDKSYLSLKRLNIKEDELFRQALRCIELEVYRAAHILAWCGYMAIVGKAEQKAMFGMLSKRNECAHPTDYFPDLNQSLGYIAEIFSRLEKLEKRFPNYQL